MYKRLIALPALGILTVICSPAGADVVADSVAEFSDVQGQDGWYYGYYDRTSDADHTYAPTDFHLMTEYAPTCWRVQSGSYWTALWINGGHPNGLNGNQGRLPYEHWAIRRWISEVAGPAQLSGRLDWMAGYQGSGIVGRIIIDGTEIWSYPLVGAAPGVDYSLSTTLNCGSIVDFAIEAYQADDSNDNTYFTAIITPEPAAIPIMACGIAAILRRRWGNRGDCSPRRR